MNYMTIKHIHMGCAALSGSFFLLRGIWMLKAPAMLQRCWVRIVPHLVDTALLASALAMVYLSRQYPFEAPWLGAKVVALVLYIVLGTIALKRGRTLKARAIAFVGALAVFAYIVSVAVTRNVFVFA